MTRTNLIRNPTVEVDLVNYAADIGSSAAWWRDTASHSQSSGTGDVASLRVATSTTTTQVGVRIEQLTLAAGTYVFAAALQQAAANSDSALTVRRQSDGLLLFDGHYDPVSPWTRFGGFFSVASSTAVDVVVGVGIYGAPQTNGSTRFDEFLLENIGAAGMSTAGFTIAGYPYFDGHSPDTDATIYAWTGTAHNSTSTATPNAGGTPGDTFQSWTLEYEDNFDSGSAPDSDHWYRQDGYRGTAGNGFRVGALAVVSNGNLELRTNGDNISGVNSKDPQLYGKWEIWMRTDSRTGYSPATFLWSALPGDPWWPGENDIWEGESKTSITSFMHQAASSATDAHPERQIGPRVTQVTTTQIHKYTIEWLPDRVTYLVDDVVAWNVTDTRYIPSTLMKLVIQLEVKLPNGTGTASGTVRPNYPQAYADPWRQTIERVRIYSASTTTDHNVHGEAIETAATSGAGTTGEYIDTATATIERHAEADEDEAPDRDAARGHLLGEIPTTPGNPIPVAVQLDNEQWHLITADGEDLELTRYVNDAELLRGMSGRGAPPARIKRVVIAGKPGDYTTEVSHGPREMSVPLRVLTSDFEALWEALARFASAMDPARGEVILRRIDLKGNAFDLNCRIEAGTQVENEGASGPTTQVLPLQIHADDPYWYGATITKGWSGAQPASWFPWLPITLGASATLGDITIVTESDVPTEPVWTIAGPGDDLVLANRSTGERLALAGSIPANGIVTIDTRFGKKSVTGPDGSNWFPMLTAYDLWKLGDKRARNEVEAVISGSASDTYISVAYRDKKLVPVA